MLFKELIDRKRMGMELSREEINFFIEGYVKGEIPDYQVSALLMAICFQGMTDRETTDLTIAMVNSGDRMNLSSIEGIKVDKHSTGGVSDDTTLIVAPLVAACGGKVAKMSGRGLGFTGGTLDKLESIPGFSIVSDSRAIAENVSRDGLAVMGQSDRLVPADKKLYALRDVTSTVESLPLIASSIMSKKLALGCDAIVLDVKTGNGAFMRDVRSAIKLADAMVGIGTLAGVRTAAVVTDMNQPLGNAVGNALAVKETIEILRENRDCAMKTVSMALASKMLILSGICGDDTEAYELMEEKLASGAALEKLAALIRNQGGNPAVTEDTSLLPQASLTVSVKAPKSGYLSAVDTKEVGNAAFLLGAGRARKEDDVDPAVGVVIGKRLGDYVEAGEEMALFHINDRTNSDNAMERFLAAYTISDEAPEELPLIYAVREQTGDKKK